MTMKPLLLALAILALLCAPASGQTLKALSYNTTNGKISYAGTNPLTFTNTVFFGDDVSINPSVSINYGGSEVINLEERTLAGDWLVAGGLNFSNATNAATTRTNLGLYNTNAPAAFAALALWDEVNDELGLRVSDDEIRVTPILIITDAPTNTTNAVKWIRVVEGTNSYRLPLFQ
jgi:hypothetical protein